ncbi:glutaredoxin family protein [Curtobacterium sp. MCBD17_021]|uniref:glutaredoxin family protein n=1 Tax=Curtobacterium sp. MCBD17_021 TaxID=2175665 RepID=UPI0021AC3FFA|nr:glutaredoxin family protein [Curtobacterium sp. MCBD17_021]
MTRRTLAHLIARSSPLHPLNEPGERMTSPTPTRTVRVYTKPNCQACDATKRWLNNRDIPFEVDDITTEANLAAAKALGHQQAPVVVVSNGTPGDEQHWSGFNPFELDKHLGAAA